MDAVESLLGAGVAILATLMIIVWIARSVLSERARVAASAGPSDDTRVAHRRVRQLDQVLIEIGLAFLLTAVGYVTLGVMPA